MFGLGDNEDDKRLWNFMLFNNYSTDEEMEKSLPAMVVVILIIIVGAAIWWLSK